MLNSWTDRISERDAFDGAYGLLCNRLEPSWYDSRCHEHLVLRRPWFHGGGVVGGDDMKDVRAKTIVDALAEETVDTEAASDRSRWERLNAKSRVGSTSYQFADLLVAEMPRFLCWLSCLRWYGNVTDRIEQDEHTIRDTTSMGRNCVQTSTVARYQVNGVPVNGY